MAAPREGEPGGLDQSLKPGLNSIYVETRLEYAVAAYRALTANPEEFGGVLDRTGHNSNQIPFVSRMANLINTGALTGLNVAMRMFEPKPPAEGEELESGQKRIAEGTYTVIDSLGVGLARLKVYAPKDTRIIDGGYVKWGIVSRTEGADLRRLADQSGDFLSLVLVDPSLLEERNLRRFIMAAHPDQQNLQPEPWLGGGILARFGGKTLFKRVQGPGVVDATFWSKDRHWNETWVEARSQEKGQVDILVGKQVYS